jgi:hypothetical protein
MSDVHEVLVLPGADADQGPLDDDAALEAALAELARGFVRLREEGR